MRKQANFWNKELIIAEVQKCSSRKEFGKKYPYLYKLAGKMGILDEICVNLPTKYTYWSIKMLQDEAFKYTNRNDFQKISPNAYWVAHKREVLDQICVYMSPSVSEAFSLEELMEAAKKNFSRNDFQKNNPREYRVACKRKDFDEICSHMKPSRGSSENEKILLSTIKNLFSDAKKFRDMKVFIPNKPLIRGFEIDILVGNLGIEFDGKYHHSFEGLKRSHPKWSDDDVRNYHEIKDSWFASKGIQILHIKEEDWIKDKEGCIQRCLKFLGIVKDKVA